MDKNIYKIQFNLSKEEYSSMMKIKESSISEPAQIGCFVGSHPRRDVQEVIKGLSCLDNTTITSKDIQDKTIYRYPNLNLPRIKVDNLKDKYNVKVTRNIEKADYCVYSSKYLEKIIDYDWANYCTVGDFQEQVFDDDFKELLTSQSIIKLNSMLFNLDPDDLITISFNYNWNSNWDSAVKPILSKVDKAKVDGYVLYVGYENIKEYKQLIQNTNLVLDSNIVSICNEGLLILTDEDVKSIESMVKSEDPENITLACEMMANCNIDESFDKLAYIHYFYFEWLRYAKNWNHINVKTLRKTLSEDFVPYGSNNAQAHYYERFVRGLVKHNHLTEFALKKTVQKLVNNGLNAFGLNRDVFMVDVSSIKLSDKYTSKLIKHQSGEEILQEITLDPIDDLPF